MILTMRVVMMMIIFLLDNDHHGHYHHNSWHYYSPLSRFYSCVDCYFDTHWPIDCHRPFWTMSSFFSCLGHLVQKLWSTAIGGSWAAGEKWWGRPLYKEILQSCYINSFPHKTHANMKNQTVSFTPWPQTTALPHGSQLSQAESHQSLPELC